MDGKYDSGEKLATPYQRARQVVDERIGSARRQAFSWRVFGLGALAIAAIAVAGLWYQSSKSKVVPYVVEVDSEGAVRLVGQPATEAYVPGEYVEKHFLEEWLLKIREVSSDREVVKADLLAAYKGVTQKAKAQMDELLEDESPFDLMKKYTRSVDFQSFNKLSDESWRVEWRETTFGKDGYVKDTQSYVGIVSLTHRRPTTKKEVERNPLGLYVTHFSLNERDSGESAAQQKENGGSK
jgi:type IV secretion system protein VirB5